MRARDGLQVKKRANRESSFCPLASKAAAAAHGGEDREGINNDPLEEFLIRGGPVGEVKRSFHFVGCDVTFDLEGWSAPNDPKDT